MIHRIETKTPDIDGCKACAYFRPHQFTIHGHCDCATRRYWGGGAVRPNEKACSELRPKG
jgi:hypothetical protein